MMRIVHCISSLSGGGAERQLSYAAPLMALKSVDVHITYLSEGPSPPDYTFSNVKLHRIVHHNNYDPLIIFRLVSLFRKIRPHLVHTWIPQMDVFGGIAARISKLPWFIREANSVHVGWKAGLRKKIAKCVNHVVANSVGGVVWWEKHLPQIPCSLVYNGLPDSVFLQSSYCDQNGNRENSHDIIYAGRLTEQKNIFLLLEAVKDLSKTLDFKLKICGIGDQENLVHAFVKQHKLENQVKFYGYVTQETLLQLFQTSALLINPSFYEGCPNVVLEAMASGCPIAVSAIPAHIDILTKKTAFFFQPDDKEELKNIIKIALCDKTKTRQMALLARRIAENFRLENTVNAYLKIYENFLSSRI